MCFRDKTYCSYYKDCIDGMFCQRALTRDVTVTAEKVDLPISQFAEKPDCFREQEDIMKCVTGCKHFTGGELKHHKDCQFYADSISEKYDIMRDQIIWAVTHYGVVNTDGIINHLKRTLETIGDAPS